MNCSDCGHPLAANAKFCKQCGTSQTPSEESVRFCESCGTSCKSYSKFCPDCGHVLGTAASTPLSPPPLNGGGKKLLPTSAKAALAGIVVVALGLGAWVAFKPSDPGNAVSTSITQNAAADEEKIKAGNLVGPIDGGSSPAAPLSSSDSTPAPVPVEPQEISPPTVTPVFSTPPVARDTAVDAGDKPRPPTTASRVPAQPKPSPKQPSLDDLLN